VNELIADLPSPSRWAVPGKRTWAISAFLGLVSLSELVLGALELLRGSTVEGIFFLTGGAMCLLVASLDALTWAIVRRRSTRFVRRATISESGETAVVIPYSMGHFWLVLSALVVSVPAFVAGGIRERSALHVMGAVFFAVLAGYCVVQIVRKKIVRGYVAMSPAGIYHRSWGAISFAPWEHVADVEAGEGAGQIIEVQVGASTKSWSRRTARLMGSTSDSPKLTVRGGFLAVDPVLVYYALLFYATNPAARPELGCDAGVQRLRTVDIPASLLHRYAYRLTIPGRRELYGLES
jgi:hypothetical protein